MTSGVAPLGERRKTRKDRRCVVYYRAWKLNRYPITGAKARQRILRFGLRKLRLVRNSNYPCARRADDPIRDPPLQLTIDGGGAQTEPNGKRVSEE